MELITNSAGAIIGRPTLQTHTHARRPRNIDFFLVDFKRTLLSSVSSHPMDKHIPTDTHTHTCIDRHTPKRS